MSFPNIFVKNGHIYIGTEDINRIIDFNIMNSFYERANKDDWYVFVSSYYNQLMVIADESLKEKLLTPTKQDLSYFEKLKEEIKFPHIILPILYQILDLEKQIIENIFNSANKEYYKIKSIVVTPENIRRNDPVDKRFRTIKFTNPDTQFQINFNHGTELYSKLKDLYIELNQHLKWEKFVIANEERGEYYILNNPDPIREIYTIQLDYRVIRALIKFVKENVKIKPRFNIEQKRELYSAIDKYKLDPYSYLFDLPKKEWNIYSTKNQNDDVIIDIENREVNFDEPIDYVENLRDEYRDIYNLCSNSQINRENIDELAADMGIIFPVDYSDEKRCTYLKNYVKLLLEQTDLA